MTPQPLAATTARPTGAAHRRPAVDLGAVPGRTAGVAGIALAGGLGLRARPMTLAARGYPRSKATVPVLGRPLIDWQVQMLRRQGIEDYFVVAKGRANRGQIQQVLRYGEAYRVRVRYSRARHDRDNTGSGEATLRNLERWDLHGTALVFPTDSLFDFDLTAMVREHRASGAIVTMASVRRDAAEVAGRYGVLVADAAGFGRRFVEKPPLAQALALAGAAGEVYTNAGMYLIDCDRLRALLAGGALAGLIDDQLDWGTDLLPWLVAQGYPVRHHPIARFGDLGSPRGYLDTMREVLRGAYPMMRRPRIDPSSLARRDPLTGRTLAEKIRSGSVRLGPNVRIGAEVEIGPGVELSDVDIGDEVDLGEGCVLAGVACQDGSIIGPHARLSDTWLGSMATLESTATHPVVTGGYTAIGDEVTVGAGLRLTGVTVHPGLSIPAFAAVRPGAELTDITDFPLTAIGH
jgi:mannose-1-phosphate guanylyltransferase / phosphomannomutase